MTQLIPKFSEVSGTVPSASGLFPGELALNIADGRLFTRNTSGSVMLLNSRNAVSASQASSASFATSTVILGVQFGNGLSAAPTSSMIIATIPYNCVIVRSEVDADVSGTATINILRASSALPGTFTSIVGTNKPSLSFQQHTTDTTLPTWTSSLFTGDKLKFTLDTMSGSALVHNALYLYKV